MWKSNPDQCTIPFSKTDVTYILLLPFKNNQPTSLLQLSESKPLNLKQVQYHFLKPLLTHLSGLEKPNKQYLSTLEPCRWIFYPRNFGFEQETHSPEYIPWWGSAHPQISSCHGSLVSVHGYRQYEQSSVSNFSTISQTGASSTF